jgi:metal-responsive CopG/Arc/MetJ family transcriptional regulator
MAKLISDKPKNRKRGRPATGKDPMIGLRAPPTLIKKIDGWATTNNVASRSDAIRHLLERGLSSTAYLTKPRRLAPNEKDRDGGRSIGEARVALQQTKRKIELALAAIARIEAKERS